MSVFSGGHMQPYERIVCPPPKESRPPGWGLGPTALGFIMSLPSPCLIACSYFCVLFHLHLHLFKCLDICEVKISCLFFSNYLDKTDVVKVKGSELGAELSWSSACLACAQEALMSSASLHKLAWVHMPVTLFLVHFGF